MLDTSNAAETRPTPASTAVAAQPAVHAEHARTSRPAPWESRFKVVFDRILAAVGLLLVSPLLGLAALLILLDDGRPILYRCRRVGQQGRVFSLLKLRTMTRDADTHVKELAHLNKGGPYMIRIANDPRVTWSGRVLRRLAIDELPQLWNVLRGDMSLVGPRPQSPDEVALYTPHERERLRSLPGITGLWQVSARAENDFARWVALDLEYQNTWSWWRDLVIIARTPIAVARGTGAERGQPHLRHGSRTLEPTSVSAWPQWRKWAPSITPEELA
jgi:lipopolysaccharide/colanic/teichoic acid biosynthesis glycosyltransferase